MSSENVLRDEECSGACALGCVHCDAGDMGERALAAPWHAPDADEATRDGKEEEDAWAHDVQGVDSGSAGPAVGDESLGSTGSSYSDDIVDPTKGLDDGSQALIRGDIAFGEDIAFLRNAGLSYMLPQRVGYFQHSVQTDPLTARVLAEFDAPRFPGGLTFMPALTQSQMALARVQLRAQLGVIAHVPMMTAMGHSVYMVRVNGQVKPVLIAD